MTPTVATTRVRAAIPTDQTSRASHSTIHPSRSSCARRASEILWNPPDLRDGIVTAAVEVAVTYKGVSDRDYKTRVLMAFQRDDTGTSYVCKEVELIPARPARAHHDA